MRPNLPKISGAVMCASVLLASHALADSVRTKAGLENVVAQTIQPIMERYGIPGMAVGLVIGGAEHVYVFGVASKTTGTPVSPDTLFEIGSVSKTLTATLASYAKVKGRLSLSDKVSTYFPSLRGSGFDEVDLLDLGTYTVGGMPLQFPDEVTNDDQMMKYFRDWKPSYPPGTVRTYANPSIGLLGLIAAKSMNGDFDALTQGDLLPALGMTHTYLNVPQAQTANYAEGYTKADVPIRMKRGVLASEAYGIKTTAGDLLRFVEANMALIALDAPLQRAITDTHTGYYRLGAMTQDLIWEQYRYPVDLADVLAGNSAKVGLEPNPVVKLVPPSRPRDDVLLNKTGSTNGFGAYVAFVPGRKAGIVMLANKNYPIDARVTAAYEILTRLNGDEEAR